MATALSRLHQRSKLWKFSWDTHKRVGSLCANRGANIRGDWRSITADARRNVPFSVMPPDAARSSASPAPTSGAFRSGFKQPRKQRRLSSNFPNTDKRSHCCADLARMMVPSDANVAGNVHGGTIMKLMEEAAGVAANRYFNQNKATTNTLTTNTNKNKVCALTSRVDRMTFQKPIYIGDVAKVHADVVFASLHTIAVSVQVTAERMAWSHPSSSDRDETVCNRALLWLVGVVLPHKPLSVHKLNPKVYLRALAPKFSKPDPEEDPQAFWAYQKAKNSYEDRKAQAAAELRRSFGGPSEEAGSDAAYTTTASSSPVACHKDTNGTMPEFCFTPAYSAVEMAQVMLPEDCVTDTGLVGGGLVMKLMDNACGVVAIRHCGTNVVTVSVDCVDLVAPVLLGDVLKIKARPTFTSAKSMEVQVSVVAERFIRNQDSLTRQDIVTVEQAYFTFVSLPLKTPDGTTYPPRTLPMRPLVLKTGEDHEQFEKGKGRYLKRKALRETGKLDMNG